jgi:predicted RND superfamily exporter protein
MSQTLDPCSGGRLERCIFNHRGLVLLTCTLATLLFGFLATGVRFNASYEKVIPTHHPFVQAYLQNRNELHGLGTSLRIVVEAKKGDIFDADYLNALKEINDEVFLTPGVDRSWMKSLWTPSVRWTEVTEEGFQGGPVMPSRFDGSAASLLQLKMNVARAGLMGSIVADDLRSSTLFVPLLDNGLDYRKLSAALETIRHKYDLPIHIVGFAKIVGDLLDGIIHVALYFAIAFVIAGIFLYYYTSCIRSTALVLTCSLIALVWQLGLVTALGYDLDPYSMLVPFLVSPSVCRTAPRK